MKAKDMPPQPGDDEPVSKEKPDITWGHLFGRKTVKPERKRMKSDEKGSPRQAWAPSEEVPGS